jgi:hypothetical protein
MTALYFSAHLQAASDALGRYQAIREAMTAQSVRSAKIKALTPVERDLARSLRVAFTAQRKAFLSAMVLTGAGFPTNEAARVAAPTVHRRLREAVTRWDIPFNDAASATLSLFTDPLQAGLEAAMKAGGTWQSMSLDIDETFSLSNPRAVTWLAGRAAEQVVGINETTRQTLEKVITDGLAQGDSYNKIASSIRSTYDGWENSAQPGIPSFLRDRADVIAVTESAFAYEAGSRSVVDDLSAAGLDMEQSVIAEDDACDDCSDNQGVGWISVNDDFPNDPPPTHPSCFPAGTMVSGPQAVGATMRWYDGEMVEIETADGALLAATPNHPVLTPEGWVAFGSLHEGGHVVSRSLAQRAGSDAPHDDDIQTVLDQVAGALHEASGVTPRAVPVAAEDFHGDGSGSKIAVVWADRELGNRLDSACSQPQGKERFAGSASAEALDGLSEPFLGDHAPMAAADRSVGGLGVGAPLLGGPAGSHEPVGVRAAPALNAPFVEHAVDDATADAAFLRESIHRYAGQVTPTEIIRVLRYPFAGHVYNLETVDGWYTANRVIVHNCRCDVLYQRAEEAA